MKNINKLQKKVSILKKKHIQNRTDRRTAMRIPIASDEQRVAVEHLLREENVYVDAVGWIGEKYDGIDHPASMSREEILDDCFQCHVAQRNHE